MTKARDLANIITGGFTADDIPNIPASKITSGQFADARIADLSATKLTGSIADARIPASAVSQHATSFDDNKIVNDISTLAIRQASNENKGAYNTNSMYVDVFQDDTGIGAETNTDRNASEYVSSAVSGTDANLVSLFRPNTTDHNGNTTIVNTVAGTSTATLRTINNGYGQSDLNSTYQKFSGSLSFPGADANDGGWKIVPTSEYDFGTNDFTIEAWTYNNNFTVSSTHKYIMDWSTNSGSNRLSIAPQNSEAWYGTTAYNGNFRPSGFGISGFANGSWTHWAWVKSSGNLALYSNGNRNFTFSDSLTYNFGSDYNGDIAFNQRYGSDSTGWTGVGIHTQEVRVSSNARYSGSTYTIPTAQFPTTAITTSATGNFISNAITAPSSTSKMGAIITYQDQAGTNTLNTDIVLQLSADNGSNLATATMTAMPDFASGIKMAKVNDLSVTAGTQLKYKISFANQASGSKEARIRGVSLQY